VLQSADIGARIVDAVLAGRLKAGTRLGEQQLAKLFAVSRTVVREALIRLETRGIVHVSSRRGWFVIEPSIEEAHEAFQARRAIELGLLYSAETVEASAVNTLEQHIARERDAIQSGDIAARSYLLGEFHVCMAELFGNRMLADILRDLTARTVLISMLYQSTHDAAESCAEHARIVAAMRAGDRDRAAHLMAEHIGHVEAGLTERIAPEPDPLAGLREALNARPATPSGPSTTKPATARRR
jgi:DNA-binding GntR family transcriptional regulator